MIKISKNSGLFKKGKIPWNKGLVGWNNGHKVSEETRKKIGEANRVSLKGHIPWNKGLKKTCKPNSGSFKKGEHKSLKTEFKKGHRQSENWKIIMSQRIDEKHQNWKGNEAGYSALHFWVRKWKGEPNICDFCGTTTAKKYEWANIDHTYKRVLEDYMRMCVSCHRKYDNKNNKKR